jgi:hypothetical protein
MALNVREYLLLGRWVRKLNYQFVECFPRQRSSVSNFQTPTPSLHAQVTE